MRIVAPQTRSTSTQCSVNASQDPQMRSTCGAFFVNADPPLWTQSVGSVSDINYFQFIRRWYRTRSESYFHKQCNHTKFDILDPVVLSEFSYELIWFSMDPTSLFHFYSILTRKPKMHLEVSKTKQKVLFDQTRCSRARILIREYLSRIMTKVNYWSILEAKS